MYVYIYICDRVCENQSYLHIKFDLILSLSNLITLFPNIYSTLSKISSYTQNFLRNSIKLTDKEIVIGVFCADKTCFYRLGHIYV